MVRFRGAKVIRNRSPLHCWLVQANHMTIRRPQRRDFSVRGVLYRPIEIGSHLHAPSHRRVHIVDVEIKEGRVADGQRRFRLAGLQTEVKIRRFNVAAL